MLFFFLACVPSELDTSDTGAEFEEHTDVTEESVLEAMDGWEDFSQYTQAIEISDTSSDVYFSIRLSHDAWNWLADPSAPTEGVSIVRPVYDEDHPSAMYALTVMFKLPGSSPATDDWQWAKVDLNTDEITFGEDTTLGCSSCHTAFKDTNRWLIAVEP